MFMYVRPAPTRSLVARTRDRWIDTVGGFVLPILCVILDPIVFKTSLIFPELGVPLLQRYVVFAYTEMVLGMAALAYWLRRQAASPLLAGLLCSGALFSLGLGVILLPFSLLGLLVWLGILGFSPFWSSFVFSRACLRAIKICLATMKPGMVAVYTSVGLLIALALSVSFQMSVNAITVPAVQRILAGDADAEARRILRWFSWATNLQPVVRAYQRETDEAKKKALSERYEELTGMSIEHYLHLLSD